MDTLGRWMAHHVAQLIREAEDVHAKDRSARVQACRDAIFALWAHRRALPNGRRPFENLEPVLRALESLDPEQKAPRYLPVPFGNRAEPEPVEPIQQWLKAAVDLDYVARLLIRQCLVQAAEGAFDKSAAWVALARAAGADEEEEAALVRTIIEERELARPAATARAAPDKIAAERRTRIQRLQIFARLAMDLVRELQRGDRSPRQPARPKNASPANEHRGKPAAKAKKTRPQRAAKTGTAGNAAKKKPEPNKKGATAAARKSKSNRGKTPDYGDKGRATGRAGTTRSRTAVVKRR